MAAIWGLDDLMRLSTYADTDLIRGSGPQLKGYATYRGTGDVVHNTPAQAAVGDYLVIAGCNGLSSAPPPSGGWANAYSSGSTGSTYSDSTRIHVKVCEASDIGSSVTLSASGYYFSSVYYVFSNPNNMFSGLTGYSMWSAIYNFVNYPKNVQRGATTSSTTSLTVPTTGNIFGPNYLRVMAIGSNPNSSDSTAGFSGSGVKINVEDGYWYRSLCSVYETGSTNLGGTATATAAGGMSFISVYLI